MDDLVRLFLGFGLPPDARRVPLGLQSQVQDEHRNIRWVKGPNLHLTVRFLGQTPRSVVNSLRDALATGLETWDAAITVRLEGTGVFPGPTRPRLLWMGLSGELDRLAELEAALHQIVEPLGFPLEPRNFIPHVTVGRVKNPQINPPDVEMYLRAEYQPVDCLLEVLHLYESRTGEQGVSYVPLASFHLGSSQQETL